MFSPSLGRWMTLDPIGYEGRDTNLYRGLANNTTNQLDPTGTDTTQIILADQLKESSWALNFELKWKPKNDSKGGIEIESWGLISSVAGKTKSDWIAELFAGKDSGAVASFTSSSEYLVVAKDFTPIDKAYTTGSIVFPGNEEQECGHYLLEAKFLLYTNKDKKFEFKAIGKGKEIGGFEATDKVSLVGEGRVQITVAQNPKTQAVAVKAKGELAAQSFDVNMLRGGAPQPKDEGELKAIKGTTVAWKVKNSK